MIQGTGRHVLLFQPDAEAPEANPQTRVLILDPVTNSGFHVIRRLQLSLLLTRELYCSTDSGVYCNIWSNGRSSCHGEILKEASFCAVTCGLPLATSIPAVFKPPYRCCEGR